MDTLMTVTRLGKMGDVNAAAVAITGMSREELIGSDFLDLFSDSKGTLRAIKAVREQGKVRDFELELKTYDGKVIPVALNATIFKNQDIPASKLASNNNITENYADDNVEIFASIKDLTEFKRKEQELKKLNKELEDLIAKDMIIHEQLVHAEKLAALGRMLASITHEINNPLQTIKNSLYLIEADTAPDNPAVEYLQIAATETERISKLVAQLREIYRPSRTLTDATFDLVSVVEQVQALVSGELEKGRVEWVLERPRTGEWEVRGEKDQIKQVFINICINAIEAMQPKGGRLEISFRQGPPASHEVGVIVRDHGPGIPAEYLDKLLEPFQTTKPKGGGLGLAISYEIVQRHKGRLSAYNYGDGAEFSVWLPSIDKKE
jgi:PAS domain S-box-containing protein